MTKPPFILGAPHLSVEDWQELFRKMIKDMEYALSCSTVSFSEKKKIARDIIDFHFFIDALPTILKNA